MKKNKGEFMKRKILKIFVLFIGLVLITGCNKNNEKNNFKNPKTIFYEDIQGKIQLTYEDDGTFTYSKSENTLKNEKENFRISLSFGTNTIEDQEKIKEKTSKDAYDIIDKVKFNGYEGYVAIDKKYATATVILYIDKKEDTVILIKVSPMQSLKAQEKINKGKKPKEVIYQLDNVQKILNTVKYEK